MDWLQSGRISISSQRDTAGPVVEDEIMRLSGKTTSGVATAAAIAFILLSSFYFVREIRFELFKIVHMLLALTVLGGIIWHILPGKFIKLLFPIISIFIWLITTLYRLARIYRNRGAYVSSYHLVVKSGDQEFGVIKVNVQVPRHESFKPGKYLYLYFTNLGWQYRFQSHPFMITWCEDSKETVDGKEFDVTNLTFLIQPRSGLTARLCRELQLSELSYRKANSRNSILFDGPYGQNLQLERYETVMLVAKGIGIAGVLPYAGYLMQRNCRDAEIKKLLRLESTANKDELRNSLHRDATRKVDLFWELELNRQEEWVFDHLRTLQDQDPDRRTNQKITL